MTARRKAAPTFASTLRTLREDAGLSSAQMATKAGMARAVYHRIEAGDRAPSWSSLQAICRALQCSLAVFDVCIRDE